MNQDKVYALPTWEISDKIFGLFFTLNFKVLFMFAII